MILKHKRGTYICTPEDSVYYNFLEDGIKNVESCLLLEKALNDYDLGEIDDDLLLAEIEDNGVLQIDSIALFYKILASDANIINKYTDRTCDVLKKLSNNLEEIYSCGCYPSEKHRELLKKQVYSVISSYAYIMYYEFNMDKTILSSMENPTDYEVDEILYSYTGMKGIPLTDFIVKIDGIRQEHKMKLEIFEEFPELEDEFDKVMGPFVLDIQDNTNLTVDLVKQVINGKIDPYVLVEILNGDSVVFEDNTTKANGFN